MPDTDHAEVVVPRDRFDGAIFDLDGVLTDTARVHAAAWKEVFDDFLRRYSARKGIEFRPFDATAEYLAHVDGRAREDGVRQFLASRGIHIPEKTGTGCAGDTVESLAARKNASVQQGLRRATGTLPGAAAVLKAMKRAGIGTAVASSSANCALVLDVTGLNRFVDVRVDGIVAAEKHLQGKPDPALFLEAASRLGATPDRVIVFEDALPGVEAGKRGGFGCVVGVDRGGNAAALLRHGADVVIRDLTQVKVPGT